MSSFMPNRRIVLAAAMATAGLVSGLVRPAAAAPKLGEDGLYHLDWYLESFLDLTEDLAGAEKSGKRFAVLWGLKGCPACRRMHEVHLSDRGIEGYIRANFEILHLNILGSREVTDFDGGRLSEKALAAKYGVNSTPTIQFFPDRAAPLAGRPVEKREVARLSTLPQPPEFLAYFRFVRERGYEKGSFEAWRAAAG